MYALTVVMTRPNKYIKRSQISEAKFRHILRLFSLDIDTSNVSQITGLNRNTVNRYFRFIRERIVNLCNQTSAPNRTAELVSKALIDMLSPFEDKVFTNTVDNGKEFSKHKDIAKALQADVYFTHPYRSWERGLNENTNGLIRQYFPKKTSFENIKEQDVAFVELRLNNRPRKSLEFKIPAQCFLDSNVALGT